MNTHRHTQSTLLLGILLFLANTITFCGHSSKNCIMLDMRESSIIWLTVILALVCVLPHRWVWIADIRVSCGKAPNAIISLIASNNVSYNMECWHELLLSTIMSYVKLLKIIFFNPTGNHQIIRSFPEITMKSGLLMLSYSIEKNSEINSYFGYQLYMLLIYV